MKQVNVRPDAELDIAKAYSYLAAESPQAAEKFFKTLYEHLTLLAHSPSIGPVVELTYQDFREVRRTPLPRPFAQYLVFYVDDPQAVVVLRVIHGKRDFPLLFE